MHEKGGLICGKERRNPPAAMESADVLNQIRRSNNEVILGYSQESGERKSIWRRFHFRLADAIDRRRFESWQVKLGRSGGTRIRETSISRLVSTAPCNVCISNFLPLRVALVTVTSASERVRERKREREQGRFIELGNSNRDK